jgi:putative flippase GtrA
VSLSLVELKERARTPGGQKAIRYSLVSAIAVAVNQVSLFLLFAGLHWTARSASVAAFAIGGVLNYYLNRRWTWGRTGRSHLLKELLPFWVIAFLGLGFSTWAADFAESVAKDVATSRSVQGLIVNAASLSAFGLLWVGKFIFFNKVLFAPRDEDLRAALADEIVA